MITMKANYLWIGAGFIPYLMHQGLSNGQQNQDLIQNGQRYLIAKRAAVAEFEKNRGEF